MSQSSNLNSFECTPELLPQVGDQPEPNNLTKYLELTDDGKYCLAYVRVKGGGSSRSCSQYCGDIGSTCVDVWDQLSDTTCTLDPIDPKVERGATCNNRKGLMDMICICDKPPADNPFPGPSPERVCGGQEQLDEAKNMCKVCLPNAEYPVMPEPVDEEDIRLRSCIIDICSLPGTATMEDKKAIAENACENDPDLPPDGVKVCSSTGRPT